MYEADSAEEANIRYSNSIINKTVLPSIYEKFEEKLKNIIKKVDADSYYYNGKESMKSSSRTSSYLWLASSEKSNGAANINVEDTTKPVWLRDFSSPRKSGSVYYWNCRINRHPSSGDANSYLSEYANNYFAIQWFFCI